MSLAVFSPQPNQASAMTAAEAMKHLSARGWIQFHPALADRLGSFKAAIFMGHALYWTRHLALKQPGRGGWWYMTARQCEQATGLTAREQAAVREQLVQQGLLSETLAGRPARLHFRVNLPVLAQWIGLHADEDGQSTITWESFAPWLKNSINFYKPLADVAGSVAAGLYLSYLLVCQRHALLSATKGQDGYFRITQEEIRIALCLGPKVQRNARERLKDRGLIVEFAGHVAVDLQALMRCLGSTQEAPEASASMSPSVGTGGSLQALRLIKDDSYAVRTRAKSAAVTRWPSAADAVQVQASEPSGRQSSRKQLSLFSRWLSETPEGHHATHQVRRMFGAPTAGHLADSEQAITAASSEQACQPFAVLSKQGPQLAENAKLPSRFVKTKLPFCRNQIKEEKNKTTTTTARAPSEPASCDKTASRRRILDASLPKGHGQETARTATPLPDSPHELILPRSLSPEWHDAVLRTLHAAPAPDRQGLLDEIEGQLSLGGKEIRNPVGYLHALIRRQAKGDLTLALADKVAADRKHRARLDLIMRATSQGKAPPRSKPDVSEVVHTLPSEEIRAKLKQLRSMYVVRQQGEAR